MRRILPGIAVFGLMLALFSCSEKTDFTAAPPSIAASPTAPYSTDTRRPSVSFPYANSFEEISDLAAEGITATFNALKLVTAEVHSGSQAIEASGTLGGEGHPELHAQFDLSRFLNVATLDLSAKTVRIFAFIPEGSPIRTVGLTAFSGGQFVAIGHRMITPGRWNDVSIDVQAVFQNHSWDYIPDSVTPERAEEIIRRSEIFEINAMQNEGADPAEARIVFDDLLIREGGSAALTVDDSVDSLRKYANARNLLIGNILTSSPGLDDAEYLQTLVQEFNLMLTSSGAWRNLQPNPGENGFDFRQDEQAVHFGTANHLAVRGPCLGWHNLLPDWLLGSADEDLDGILTTYIETVMRRYAGDILIWDVFNEVINDAGNGFRNRDGVTSPEGFRNLAHSIWLRNGDTAIIKKAFYTARDICSACTLILNEFGNEETGSPRGNAEYPAAKSEFFYRFVKEMVDGGVPIDGVGFQLHLDESRITDLDAFLANVDRNVKRYAELELEVQFTELDVRIHIDDIDLSTNFGKKTLTARLARQAEIYRGLMRIALRNKNVSVFMLFGLTDRYSPIAGTNPGTGYAHIFDENYIPKPAYYALLEELKAGAGD
jgi:GH35 family endo-1,4-beta-xylanase